MQRVFLFVAWDDHFYMTISYRSDQISIFQIISTDMVLAWMHVRNIKEANDVTVYLWVHLRYEVSD